MKLPRYDDPPVLVDEKDVNYLALPGILGRILFEKLDVNKCAYIEKIVSEHYGVSVKAMRGKDRHRYVAEPRQVIMYMLKKYIQRITLVSIGMRFNRDYTTVIHSISAVKDMIYSDANFKEELMQLDAKIKSLLEVV